MLVVKPFLEYKEYKVKLLQRKLRGDVELEDVNPYQVFHDVNNGALTNPLAVGSTTFRLRRRARRQHERQSAAAEGHRG
jgi:hypothetical protein